MERAPAPGTAGLREVITTFAFAVRLARQADVRLLAQVLAIQFTTAIGLGLAMLALYRVLGAVIPTAGGTPNAESMVPAVAGGILLGTAGGVLRAVRAARERLLAVEVDRYVVGIVLRSAAEAELLDFEDADFHDRLHRAVVASRNQPAAMVTTAMSVLQALLTVIAVTGATVMTAWWLLPFVVLAAAPVFRAAGKERSAGYRMHHDLAEDRRHRAYLEQLLTGRDEAKEVRSLNLGAVLRARWQARYDLEVERTRRLYRKYMWRKVVARCSGDAVVLGVVVAAWFAVRADIGRLSAALTALPALWLISTRVQSIGDLLGGLSESVLHLRDLREFVTPPAGDRLLGSAADRRPFRTLRATAVGFTYPGQALPALRDVDITIRAGQVVALVGANGSGKTTLAKILAGLYPHDAGTLHVDGEPVMDLRELRERTAVLFQDFLRYKLPVLDNIAFGRAEEEVDWERAVEAGVRADAHDYLQRLPEGYATVLGKEFAGGADLSLGQWQRLAVARAFYRDAPFIVFDEPTASLDPQAEADFFERVRDLFARRAVLLISHRFASVRNADRIYVLDGGRVVEEGTHTELMEADGTYARLFRLQAESFRDALPGALGVEPGHRVRR